MFNLKQSSLAFGAWPTAEQLPIVYVEAYNIKFYGLEKLHPFDSAKFEKIKLQLEADGLLKPGQARSYHCNWAYCAVQTSILQVIAPKELSREALLDVHEEEYLDELHKKGKLLQVWAIPYGLHSDGAKLQSDSLVLEYRSQRHHSWPSFPTGCCRDISTGP